MHIDTTHGVVDHLDPGLFAHRNLHDAARFVSHLQSRQSPYVPLETCLRGGGDALTVDDATVAGARAALLARKLGHAVTIFLNGYYIEYAEPYFFCRLNAALDGTRVTTLEWEGRGHDLRSEAGKQRFRTVIKAQLARLGQDRDRQQLVSDIGRLLGVENLPLPPFLHTITRAGLMELAAEGVDIQNHGWTHVRVGALPPDQHAEDIRRGRDWLRAACGAEADLFAVPNGDGMPPWNTSPDYRTWFLLDDSQPPGMRAPGIMNRRTLHLPPRDPQQAPPPARPTPHPCHTPCASA